MQKTYVAKKSNVIRQWYLVDVQGKILGRVASKIAGILRGKHKSIYTPYIDTGDGVIIINAAKITVTGRKLKDKLYRRYSGYPGGLKEVTLEEMLDKKPCEVLRLAVKRMLSDGPLGRDMLKKLRIYSDDRHPHKSQKPIILEV